MPSGVPLMLHCTSSNGGTPFPAFLVKTAYFFLAQVHSGSRYAPGPRSELVMRHLMFVLPVSSIGVRSSTTVTASQPGSFSHLVTQTEATSLKSTSTRPPVANASLSGELYSGLLKCGS